MPEKSAEEWAKDLGVKFFDDIQPQRIELDADLGFETWIKAIQRNAKHAAMLEAAEIDRIWQAGRRTYQDPSICTHATAEQAILPRIGKSKRCHFPRLRKT